MPRRCSPNWTRSSRGPSGSFRSGTTRHRTRMPRPKPSALTGSAELNMMIERIAPDILELLADGVPRSKAAIVETLADQHERQDVTSTLIRLSVTMQVVET